MEKISFTEAKAMLETDGEALVVIGCDITGPNEKGWIDGVSLFLKDQNCIEEDFKKIVVMETSGGRTDLVFFLPEKTNICKLAIVRLSMPDCSWLSDYIVNYKDQHAA